MGCNCDSSKKGTVIGIKNESEKKMSVINDGVYVPPSCLLFGMSLDANVSELEETTELENTVKT